MIDFAAELAQTPALYPQKYDAARDAVYFVRLNEAAYRAASFLDDRVLTPGMQGAWRPFAEVASATQGAGGALPLHFIFHTGHVGSTLLSRLIDEAGGVLGLREPLPLRTLAEMSDMPGGGETFEARLAIFVRLWRRGFPGTKAVVLKATSSSGRLAPAAMRAAAGSKAVYLNLKAEPYLATLLAGANALVDLRGFEQERSRRLSAAIGPVQPSSIGELAAMSWLAESLTRARTLEMMGPRVLALDFDRMLADPGAALAGVLAHLGIAAPPGFAASVARSPVLTRYSKAPEQFAYSPEMRAQLLAQARAEFGGEIRRGLKFLEQLGARDARVAAVL